MSGGKPTLYWDTCIWLAWIKDEKRLDPTEMAAIQEQVERFHNGEVVLATSVLTLSEMLDLKNKMSADAHRKFQRFFRRPDVVRIAVDIRVAELTQRLRDFYLLQNKTDGLPTLELGDALHLASAIHYKVNEFVTLDVRDSKKPSRRKRGILPLSGNVAGFNLVVSKPTMLKKQIPLPLPARPDVTNGEQQTAIPSDNG